MRWQLITQSAAIVKEYIVDELADAGVFKYPKRARILEYGSHMETPGPQPRATVDVTIESFTVNSREPDDEVFTINPAKASLIFDADNQVGIPVPK